MRISPLDHSDDAAWEAWYAAYLAADSYGRSRPTTWKSRELRAQLLLPSRSERHQAFTGIEAGRVVVTGWLELLLKDNFDLALIRVHVPPDCRRNGYGTAMLGHLEGLAEVAGRHRCVVEVNHTYAGGPAAVGEPGPEFLRARGYAFALGSVRRDLDLPVDPGTLSRLREEAQRFHTDYGFRQFAGACPEDIIVELGLLAGSISVEAPMGDLDLHEEVYDAERIREEEALLEASGRRRYTTVAVAPGGTLAGYSDLVVATEDPGMVYQWGTVVAPAHRGHRLGMAVKVRNLELLQAHEADIDTLSTYNADANVHMIGINEQLGFRPVERLAEFQKVL